MMLSGSSLKREKLDLSIVKIQYSKENTEAVGAGFFITSAGHILTCQHVIDNVEDENEIWVSWIKLTEPVKTEYCKDLSDSSDRKDFAILKVSFSCNPHIKLPLKLDIGVDCNPEDTITGKGFQSSKFDLYPASGVILGDTIRKKDGCRFWVLKEAKYVDKGISGSPALNTKTNKVIGIFTEQEFKKEQLSDIGITAIIDKSALVTPIDEIARELHLRNIKDPDISRFINSILFEPFENESEFESDTKEILNMMDYEIEDEPISGIIPATPPTFIASQEGDFETNRTLFQCIYGMTDENAVISFHSIYHLNQVPLKLKFAVIITNTFISPSVKILAAQYQIKLLSSHDLLNSVMKINRYLKSKCKEYIQNNKLFYTSPFKVSFGKFKSIF